jgi:hypothetical protein
VTGVITWRTLFLRQSGGDVDLVVGEHTECIGVLDVSSRAPDRGVAMQHDGAQALCQLVAAPWLNSMT